MASVPKGGRIHLVQEGVQDQFFTGSPQITYFRTLHDNQSTYVLQTYKNVPDSELKFGKTRTIRLNSVGDIITNVFLNTELSSITTTLDLPEDITNKFEAPVSSLYSYYSSLNWFDNSAGYTPWYYFGGFVPIGTDPKDKFKEWNSELNINDPSEDPLGRYVAFGTNGTTLVTDVTRLYLGFRKQMSLDVRSTRDTMSTAYFPQGEITELQNTINFQLKNNSSRVIYIMFNLRYEENKFVIYKIDSVNNDSGWSYNVLHINGSGTDINDYIFDDAKITNVSQEGMAWQSQFSKQLQIRLLYTDPVIYYRIGYTDSIGNAMIDRVDLNIGGQTIESLNGELIHNYNSFYRSETEHDALKWLDGTTGTKRGLGIAKTNYTRPNAPARYPIMLNTFLPFSFTRNSALAIPVSSLFYQHVELSVTLKDFNQLFVSEYPIPDDIKESLTASILNSVVPTQYIYFDDTLSDYMKNHKHMYLVSQYQLHEDEIPENGTSLELDVEFINPVKELFFMVQKQSAIDDNDWYNYSGFDNIGLTFNGSTRFENSVMTEDYMRSLSTKIHTRCTSNNASSYSFAIDPESPFPSGQVNMSRIKSQRFDINVTPDNVLKKVRIYAQSCNILNISSGIAGMLFIDNNKTI